MSSRLKDFWWKKRRRWKKKEPRNYKRVTLVSLVCLTLIVITSVAVYVIAQQRRARRVEVNGATITVKAGGDFQAALNRAKAGDTILLEAGATFNGSFTLPKKTGEQFITIRSSAPDSQLPASNQRIDPQRYAKVLPKIISTTVEPAIKTEDGAHHYRFVAVEFGPTKDGTFNIISIGNADEKRIEDLPHHIEFDRVYIHGSPTEGQRRGIGANGKYIRIINSYISDIKKRGDESQAICAWGSDGPLEIVNNYLEAAAENVLLGGAYNPNLQLTPSDVVIRDNHFNKPLHWRNEGWVVKNLFEIKNGRRVKVTNNLMTNNWVSGQNSTAILFTVRADSSPKATIEDVEFSGNIVRSSGGALNLIGNESLGGHRLTIRNNVFDDIDSTKWGGNGQFLLATAWDGVVIENNTIMHTGNITTGYGEPTKGFVFRNNVIRYNEYGFFGDTIGVGQKALDMYFPNSIVTNNAIIGGIGSNLKGKNMYPVSIEELKFTNPKNGDYRLMPNSPLKSKGVSGTDIGANLDPQKVGKMDLK
jgi:hypothetical protein